MRKFEKGDLVTVVPGPTAQYYRVVDIDSHDVATIHYRTNAGQMTRPALIAANELLPAKGLPWGHKLVEVTEGYIYLEDIGGEARSVTNCIEKLIDALQQIVEEGINKRALYYKDSMGRIDQVLLGEYLSVDGFYGGMRNEQLNAVREKYGHRDYDGGR